MANAKEVERLSWNQKYISGELEGSLLAFLDDENDSKRYLQEEYSGEAFRVSNREQANWALRKIARIESARKECRELVEGEMEKLSAWLKKEEEGFDQERNFFECLLRDYMEEQRQQDPKIKSIKLPSGKVGLRKQQPEFQRDNSRLLPWLKANHPELVRVKEEPDWSAVKAAAVVLGNILADPDTGEVIEGVKVIERPDKLLIEFE